MVILPKEGENYKIKGDDIQVVEITIGEGEEVVAESGNLFYMSGNIQMEAKSGGNGLLSALGKIVKRKLVGESAFLTYFKGKGIVAFSSDKIGKVVPIRLENDTLYAQRDAYLCSIGDIELDIALQRKLGGGLFGGEGFILEKITGNGTVFLTATGYLEVRELQNETLLVETAKAVAWSEGIDYSIEIVGDIKTALFGDIGLFLTKLSGTGIVILQSVNFERLKQEILKDVNRD